MINKNEYFSAPELLNATKQNNNNLRNLNLEKCDVFSLGMVFFRMLCLNQVKLEEISDWND